MPPELFAQVDWRPKPPPPPKPVAQRPVAPGLPFRYLGKVIDGDKVTAFLGEGPRTHMLRTGDVLANYRVEEVTASGITLVYLPLNETQELNFGTDN